MLHSESLDSEKAYDRSTVNSNDLEMLIIPVLIEEDHSDASPSKKQERLINWDHFKIVIEANCEIQKLKLGVTQKHHDEHNE